MSAVLSSQNSIRARKQHRCSLCGELIPADTLYDKRSGVDMDGFWNMHMHPECHAFEEKSVDPDWYEDPSFPAFDRADAVAFQLTKQ